jgi:TonB-linked SusC/RagA family outer membrane protein
MNNYCRLFLNNFVKTCLLLFVVMTIGTKNIDAQTNSLQKIALQRIQSEHQSSDELLVSVHIKNLNLPKALRKVAHKANIGISFNANNLPSRKVSLHAKNMPIYKAMQHLLHGTGLEAVRSKSHDVLIIQKKPKLKITSVQQETVSGTVTDSATGKTLPGVNILLKGTSTGTATDNNGKYSITVPSLEGDTLVFNYIGYSKEIIPIQGRTKINVSMTPKVLQGKDLVVVGYGKQKKISLIGAQSTIDSTDILKSPGGSFTNTLAGRLPGVVGVQRTGKPGSDASDIWIRGIATFNNSGPLILVDGIERPMNSLNPDDIASVTILKDAASTAVYGARGANGVILIKTKRGDKKSPTFTVDFYQGVTMLTKTPDLVNGPTFMRLANEASKARGGGSIFSQERIKKTANNVNPLLYPDVNWVNTIFNKNGQNRQVNVKASGGSDIAQYRVSLSWYNEKGLLPNVDTTGYNTNVGYNKYNLSSNITVQVTPTTEANLGVGGYLTDRDYPAVSVQSMYEQALYINPVIYPVMYPGGRVPGRNSNGDLRNPYADATTRGYSDEFLSQLFTNLSVTQDLSMLTKGLSLKGLFGFDTENSNTVNRTKRLNTYYVNPSDPYDVDGTYYYDLTFEGSPTLSYDNSNGGSRKFYLEADVNYDRHFGKRHHVTGLLHYHQSDNQDAFAGDLVTSIPHRERALAARISYSYDNRYFIQFNGGYTGSENFAPSHRYGFFPSFGAGWVLSNEKFWESSFLGNIFQYFKVRYSDGLVGASGNPGRRFAFLTVYNKGASGYTYGIHNNYGRGGINVSAYGVRVQWAKARKQDLGLIFRTQNNHLSMTIDFFKQDRKNIFLRNASMPNFVGLESDPLGNFGEIENRGLDGKIKYSNSFTNDLSFSLRGTFTYNKDKIINNSQPPQKYPWLDHRGNNILADYGYIAEGLFKDQQEIDNHATQFGTVLPGDIKYKDLNDDGKINGLDVAKIGRGDVPYLTVGTGLSLRYKTIDVSAFFQGQFGADRQLHGYGVQPFYGDGGDGNVFTAALDHWSVDDPDPNAAYPRLGYGADVNVNNYKTSSFWERRINFIRMRLVEVGYTFPLTGVIGKKLRNVRIYFRGRNLLTFSKFHLWDPELNTANGTRYPNNKVYSVGFQVKF